MTHSLKCLFGRHGLHYNVAGSYTTIVSWFAFNTIVYRSYRLSGIFMPAAQG
jgi:hypothetical protein